MPPCWRPFAILYMCVCVCAFMHVHVRACGDTPHAERYRNPSSLIRYGQEEWYPRSGPTTRLAALDAERIPNRKGTSRCVNDDPAPGQG